jgi:hypothetical protein
MIKNIKNKLIYTFVFGIISIPILSHAEWSVTKQLVPCNGPDCTFNSLVQLANNIIDFIVYISVPVSAIMFAYAGWLYITSSTSGNIEKAHKIFVSVGLGLLFILGAWLIVKAILTGMGAEGKSLLSLI